MIIVAAAFNATYSYYQKCEDNIFWYAPLLCAIRMIGPLSCMSEIMRMRDFIANSYEHTE